MTPFFSFGTLGNTWSVFPALESGGDLNSSQWEAGRKVLDLAALSYSTWEDGGSWLDQVEFLTGTSQGPFFCEAENLCVECFPDCSGAEITELQSG